MEVPHSMVGRLELQTRQAYESLCKAVHFSHIQDVEWAGALYSALGNTLKQDAGSPEFFQLERGNPLDRYCLQFAMGDIISGKLKDALGREKADKGSYNIKLKGKAIHAIDDGNNYGAIRTLVQELCENSQFYDAMGVLEHVRDSTSMRAYLILTDGVGPDGETFQLMSLNVPRRFQVTIYFPHQDYGNDSTEGVMGISYNLDVMERELDNIINQPHGLFGSRSLVEIHLFERDIVDIEELFVWYRSAAVGSATMTTVGETPRKVLAEKLGSYLKAGVKLVP
ncbi:hypothetical protein HY501_02970 [Candidatus Woesearchaeota archaeon]|nr:hypothetical protein [Candidatus Woesearchaeota archaeon]